MEIDRSRERQCAVEDAGFLTGLVRASHHVGLAGCRGARVITVDVAIIGAGFSGLSSALALRDGGTRVLLLEAQDVPGGRVKTVVHADGHAYEKGGQFFARYMTHLCDLVARYGLNRRKVRKRPGAVAILNGRRKVFDDDVPELGFFDLLFSEGTDPNQPGSLLDWALAQGLEEDAFRMFQTGCEEITGRTLGELSFRSVHDCLSRFESLENSNEFACREGLGTLAGLMARDLGPDFRANSPVSAVDRRDGLFHLTTPQGIVSAHQVIFAAGPAVLGNVDWTAPQDAWLRDHSRHFVAGKMIKVVLRYDTAFWLDSDFGSAGQTDDPLGFSVMDASDPDGGPECLAAFCGGTAAMVMEGLSEPQVLAKVMDILEPMLGPRVRHPVTVVQTNWTDHRWVGGGYDTWARPWEGEDPWAPLRADHSGLHFAVSELAAAYPGLIEGACRRGREVADRILRGA